MQPQVEDRQEQPAKTTPPQFSLRTMFVVTTSLAVVLPLLLTAPLQVRVICSGVLVIMLPVVLTTALVYGHGYYRTFCIGALIPAGLTAMPVGSSWLFIASMQQSLDPFFGDTPYAPAIYVAVDFLASLLAGLVAILVRWLIERPKHPLADPESPETSS